MLAENLKAVFSKSRFGLVEKTAYSQKGREHYTTHILMSTRSDLNWNKYGVLECEISAKLASGKLRWGAVKDALRKARNREKFKRLVDNPQECALRPKSKKLKVNKKIIIRRH